METIQITKIPARIKNNIESAIFHTLATELRHSKQGRKEIEIITPYKGFEIIRAEVRYTLDIIREGHQGNYFEVPDPGEAKAEVSVCLYNEDGYEIEKHPDLEKELNYELSTL